MSVSMCVVAAPSGRKEEDCGRAALHCNARPPMCISNTENVKYKTL